jgi:hypothetical protein
MNDPGDVLIGITYKGVASNRVRVASGMLAMDRRTMMAQDRRREQRRQCRHQRLRRALSLSDVQTIIASASSLGRCVHQSSGHSRGDR